MNVGQLCKRDAVTVRPSDELTAAARLMRDHHVGYLVGVEPDFTGSTLRPVGVLTDRDIVVTMVAHDVDPRSVDVRDVMTHNPVVLNARDTLPAAILELRRVGVRRMPVVGEMGELRGVLSIDDVLDNIASELQNLAGAVRNEQRIERNLRS